MDDSSSIRPSAGRFRPPSAMFPVAPKTKPDDPGIPAWNTGLGERYPPGRRRPAPDLRSGAHAAGSEEVEVASSHRDTGRRSPFPVGHRERGSRRRPPRRSNDMTTQKSFKRRVRKRMAKTGESYTTARRMLIAAGDRPEPVQIDWTPPVSEEAMTNATGHGWDHWFGLLDAWGGTSRTHPEIARWLSEEHGVPPWWTQSVTVGYEQARGMRAPGQHADGWAVTATKTVGVPVHRLFEAFADDGFRERWLPGAELRLRTATAPKSARYDWEDGSTRVNVGFIAVSGDKSTVAVEHARLPDADTAGEMKAWWRERVAALKSLLEHETANA